MLQFHFFHRRTPGCAGVVDEGVDASELRKRFLYHITNMIRVFHVACESQRLDAKLLQFVGGLFATLLLARAKHQVGSHFAQAFRHLAAEPDRAAGNAGPASGKIKELLDVHDRGWLASMRTKE